jgi:ABC-type nitrate/sulfonate/bicarbonate transport system substrate-binding protein
MTTNRRFSRRKILQAGAGLMALSAAGTATRLAPFAAPAVAQGFDEVIVQLNWIKNVQHGGHFAAIEKGFYREERLNVDVKPGGPGIDSIALTANGRAHIGDRDSTNVMLARGRGIPIKGFAVSYQANPFSLISLRKNPVRTLEEMKGKTFALHPGRRPSMVALLRRAKIDPSTVTFVPASGDATVLVSGQVDGYFGWATNEGLALRTRGVDVEIINLGDLGDPSYPQVFFATDETLRDKPDLLARWLRASQKGWRYFADNPEEVARFTVEKYGYKGLDLKQMIAEGKEYRPYILGGAAATRGVMAIGTENFAAAIRLAREAGLLKEDLSASSMVDLRPWQLAGGKA